MKPPASLSLLWGTILFSLSMEKWEPVKRLSSRALCQELGVEDVVTSPTFAVINEYRSDIAERN